MMQSPSDSGRAGIRGRRVPLQSALLGLLIGVACIAVLLLRVDVKQSFKTLGQLNVLVILFPITLFCVNLLLRAWRWQRIFPAPARPAFGACLTVLGIGNMANFLLPGRAGDLARCVLLDPSSITESARTLATLAVERVLDGLALVGMALFSVWVLHPPHWVMNLLRGAILIFGAAIVLLLILRFHTEKLVHWTRRVLLAFHMTSAEQRFESLLTSFADGLSAVSSAGQMSLLLFITAAVWATEAALLWALARALSLQISLQSSVVACAVLSLSLLSPAAPGGLGTYELFGTEAFKLVGIEASHGLALTVVIHAWVFVANIVAGIFLLAVKGISLRQLRTRLHNDSAAQLAEAESAIRQR